MKKIIPLLLICALLPSCANLAPRDFEYTWVKSERPPLPMTVKVVSQEEVKKHCNTGMHVWACAVYYWIVETKEYTECIVYTSYKNLPDFLIGHEKKHCDGWDHVEK
jgi:hypothetical protein